MVDILPVDIPKESMRHDLLGICRSRAKSQFRLTSEQFLQNGDRITRHVNGIKRFISKNSIVDLIFIFTPEWRLLEEHLVDEHAECPPVDCTTVLLVQKNLSPKVSKASKEETYVVMWL